MHASINSRLSKWDVGEGEVENMASAVRWLSWHTNIVHRGGSSPSSELCAAVGCSNSRFKGLVPGVKVSSYKTVLGRYKMRNVSKYVRGM